MYPENEYHEKARGGCIEVICGSMFSGKTEELIRRLKRARIARLRVEIFKPDTDRRYHAENVVSHDENSLNATAVNSAADILRLGAEAQIVGIDEAQFFDEGLIPVVQQLADEGKRVIIAGLDMDFLGKPFGPVPMLMAISEYVTKVHAICVYCGELANFSHRIHHSEGLIKIGERESYQPLCRKHFNELNRK
jgi:thymidine kinase